MEKKPNEATSSAPSRGVYLLPNLLTTAALFAAFYSIVAAMKGHFEMAAGAIFVAMIADTLDGRVARMTNTQTAFGAQYDSLSDMVAFGVAPALVVYSWSLAYLGKLGWLVAFIYTAATALRLARFNTQTHDQDRQYFQGLPSPAAAGVVASTVWLGYVCGVSGIFIATIAAMLTLGVAGLMVSTIRYHSFKKIDWKGRVPFVVAVLFVVMLVGVAISPPQVLFALFCLYSFSGPIITLLQIRKMRRLKKQLKNRHRE